MKHIGIDISKDTFHVAWNDEKVEVFANSKTGITAFEESLHHRQYSANQTQISLESTGIYHLLFCVLLTDHNWQVMVINPYIVSKAIASSLRHVKNDKKDALTIRKVGIMGEGYLFTDTEEVLQLKALLREYATLTKLKTKCRNMIQIQEKYQETTDKNLKSCFPKLLKTLEETLNQTQKRLAKPNIKVQKLLQTIPGIGPICSSALVAHIGNIDRFNKPEKLVAYIGLDCRVHQSGTSIHGKGFLTKRGNPVLRSLLFNAAYVARQHNSDLKVFFEKKKAEGKHHFTATCAVERKLIHIIYAVWKRQTPFIKR
jgi:transposase